MSRSTRASEEDRVLPSFKLVMLKEEDNTTCDACETKLDEKKKSCKLCDVPYCESCASKLQSLCWKCDTNYKDCRCKQPYLGTTQVPICDGCYFEYAESHPPKRANTHELFEHEAHEYWEIAIKNWSKAFPNSKSKVEFKRKG